MQEYIDDPQFLPVDATGSSTIDNTGNVDHHRYILTSVSTEENGDIELGTTTYNTPQLSLLPPRPTSPRPTTINNNNNKLLVARPTQIRRGNSKSGIVSCVTSGKDEVRVQTAYLRSEHLQGPRTPHERRTSAILWGLNKNSALHQHQKQQQLRSKKKSQKKRSNRSNNLNNSIHRNGSTNNELGPTHSSKHGLYMVSSRYMASDDNEFDESGEIIVVEAPFEQYCLQKVEATSRISRILKLFGFGGGTILSIYDNSQTQTTPCLCCGIELNLIVVNFFHWMFRQTFMTLILTLSICFIVVSILFAIGIYIYALNYPRCIVGVDYSKTHYFTDAYILSWTTLSTCGYGAIQPVIPDKVGDCLFITILMALEGFFGVLIGSLCSAIFFAKVSRIQSFAQVDFSDVVCIRYGHGQNDENPIGNNRGKNTTIREDESSGAMNFDNDIKLPCPILEFRLVNRMHNIPGGEIVDARINVVASIDSSNVSTFISRDGASRSPNGSSMKRRPGKKRRVARGIGTNTQPPNYSLSERVSSMRMMGTTRSQDNGNGFDQKHQMPIPRTILTKLECENLDHPFFKRVFTIRHKLDEYSPLLKVGPKLMIQANNGYWPHELNDARSVRESIHFDELIIRLTGLSNADANTVFSHTVYDFTDLRVGYQFTHMLYRSPKDGSLRADNHLLSSVVEQDGGGGEELKSNNNNNVRRVRDISMRL